MITLCSQPSCHVHSQVASSPSPSTNPALCTSQPFLSLPFPSFSFPPLLLHFLCHDPPSCLSHLTPTCARGPQEHPPVPPTCSSAFFLSEREYWCFWLLKHLMAAFIPLFLKTDPSHFTLPADNAGYQNSFILHIQVKWNGRMLCIYSSGYTRLQFSNY